MNENVTEWKLKRMVVVNSVEMQPQEHHIGDRCNDGKNKMNRVVENFKTKTITVFEAISLLNARRINLWEETKRLEFITFKLFHVFRKMKQIV